MATPRDTDASTPAGAFDKALIFLSVMAAAVMVLAAVLVIRGGGSAGAATPESQTGNLALSEFTIEGDLDFSTGPVVLVVENQGSQVHNLTVEGGDATPDLATGETASLDLGSISEGSYLVFCSIAGHREAGMEAVLNVGASGGSTDHTAGHETEADWAAMDRIMMESIQAFPVETEGRGNQPLEPDVLADGTKEFHLTAAITEWEVSPGKVVGAWTYNGMVPAPAIRVEVGDRVRVVLENQLPLGTDIHWHGVKVPNAMDGVAPITQPLVEPGESFVYEFVATEPAIAMYHAHAHGHMQVPNGLFGTFIVGETPVPRGATISGVEIPADMEITHEIPMVLNDAGVIGLTLNAKSFPATEPYVGKVGDWVVVHYFNEGMQAHPMHQHQFPQLVFAKDGIPLDHPYWGDTVNIAPGERYSVLFQLADPGIWVWHCHILNHVESDNGMFGMVTAWIVEE